MAHRNPGSDTWEMAMRSHELWRLLAESLREQGMDPQEHMGWKNTGIHNTRKTRKTLLFLFFVFFFLILYICIYVCISIFLCFFY